MITTFYPFSEVPFGKDLPPSELLSTPAFDELAHRLEYLRHRRGLMLLTGEPGTGKTAAVRAFVQQLNLPVGSGGGRRRIHRWDGDVGRRVCLFAR